MITKTATADLVKVNPIETTTDIYDVVAHAIHKVEELEDIAATLRKDSTLVLAELESVLQFLDPQ
ncbi:hypothetical protein LCGC14_0532340 [marine sediment metagenome]|uniref:Uncharacterized protein n=1 Tax=marine sediment metagenome TaxID=412755 RepID=A0A0F9RVC1_9ZZZZ